MAFQLLPFEEGGNLLARWWRQSVRPWRAGGSLWDEAYRGGSLGAPLGFAYLWVLVCCLPLALGGWLGLRAAGAALGPFMGMALAKPLGTLPGFLAVFLLSPVLALLPGGWAAHGLARFLAPQARGNLRGTLRVLGYAWAWALPLAGLAGGAILYLLFRGSFLLGALGGVGGAFPFPFPLHQALAGTGLALAGLPVFLTLAVWGLGSLHRMGPWKALPAALAAWGVVAFCGLGVFVAVNRSAAALAQGRDGKGRELRPGNEDGSPGGRIRFLARVVEETRSRVEGECRAAGLPAPPTTVELLTGGDWGAAVDLRQALESGYLPSCRIVRDRTLGSLKGQVLHGTHCLGEGLGTDLESPAPLLPPGAEAQARRIRESLTPERKGALARVRDLYLGAIRILRREVVLQAVPAAQVPEAPAAPPPSLPPPPPADPNLPSLRNYAQAPLAQVRKLALGGYPAAMDELGRRLCLGRPGPGGEPPERDPALGVSWLIKAFNAGFRDAESCAAIQEACSPGSPEALRWQGRAELIRAAEQRRRDYEAAVAAARGQGAQGQ